MSWRAIRRSSSTSSTSRARRPVRFKFEESARRRWGIRTCWPRSARRRTWRRLDRLIEINRRLANPRGLSPGRGDEAGAGGTRVLFPLRNDPLDRSRQHPVDHRDRPPARDRRPAPTSSRSSTTSSCCSCPSQNPDGQVPGHRSLVQDQGHAVQPDLSGPVPQVRRPRRQPRLVHVHAEGDAAGGREIQNMYKPIITHDMHQMGAAERAHLRAAVRRSLRSRTSIRSSRRSTSPSARRWRRRSSSEGKGGVELLTRYDLWAPARQYMVYHGQPRILTEIASVNLADPFVNPPDGAPIGPQEARWNFPLPYRKSDWHLRAHRRLRRHRRVCRHVARRQVPDDVARELLPVHADWVNRTEPPVRVRRPGRAARLFETLRDARHPADRRGRDPPGARRRSPPAASSTRPDPG